MAVEGEVAGVPENKAERVFTWEVEGCEKEAKERWYQSIAKDCFKDEV